MALDPDALISSRHLRRAGMSSAFYRAIERGEFVRLAHGVYLATATWNRMNPDERHTARIHAVVRSGPSSTIGFMSAARLWGLPQVGAWSTRVDLLRDRPRGGPHPFTVPHVGAVPDELVVIDGVTVTSLERTLVDVAVSERMSTAVAMIDFALSDRAARETGRPQFPTTTERLLDELERRNPRRGRATAKAAIGFADGLSGSPGESVSRTAMHVIGAPAPQLQVEFVDHEGSMFADFWWERFLVFGEFDGLGKYLKPELLQPGESTADAVIREKKREDRIRATPTHPTGARWDWPIAWNRAGLERTLRGAGVTW